MTVVGMDLLPRDAELARRAAGGDGAAFVRLYDHYSTEVFTAALAETGSIEAAAGATQTAFLRVLRWPPPLGAPDGGGWLRSETVARAGAQFDQDWSRHLWSAPQPDPEPERETVRERPRRARRLFARLTRPLPSPAAVAAVLALVLFAGGAATIL